MVGGGICVPVINFIIRVYLQTVNESFLMSYFRLFAASYQLYNEYYSCYNDSCYSVIDNISFNLAFNNTAVPIPLPQTTIADLVILSALISIRVKAAPK